MVTAAATPTRIVRPAPPPSSAPSWQDRAARAYRQQDLAAELANHLLALTGRHIPPAAVQADQTTGTATTLLDGVLFRLRNHQLRVVGLDPTQTESPPIETLADLGFALAALDADDQAEDPPDWNSW